MNNVSKFDCYKQYFYDSKYNFYRYKNKKITKITRKEYKEKTGESDFIIEKLNKSKWRWQYNDYFFLKSGQNYAPIDWNIFKIVKIFNDNNIITSSSDYGGIFSIILGKDQKDIETIVKLLGKENVKFCKKGEDDGKFEERMIKQNLKFPDKVRIYTYRNSYTLLINHKMIKWIHNKLGAEMPKHSDAHTGRRIVYDGTVMMLFREN
jgi:hypothetical protein